MRTLGAACPTVGSRPSELVNDTRAVRREKGSEDGSAGDGITGDESTGSCGRHEFKLKPHRPGLDHRRAQGRRKASV